MVDAGDHEGGDHAAEFGDDDFVVGSRGHFLVQPNAEIDEGQYLPAQVKAAEHRVMMLVGHGRDGRDADYFQHLGDVYAVISPINLAVFLFINVKFDDFKFIAGGIKKKIIVAHGHLRVGLRLSTIS